MTIVTVVPGIEGEFDLKTGCINWQGSKFGNGYARKWLEGKTVLVHRLVLESKIAGFLDSGYLLATPATIEAASTRHIW